MSSRSRNSSPRASRSPRSRSASGSQPNTQAQAPSQPTTPTENRKAQIKATGAGEKAASSAYQQALVQVNSCDPLSVGYDECQARLQRAARLLIEAREAHRRALAGAEAQEA